MESAGTQELMSGEAPKLELEWSWRDFGGRIFEQDKATNTLYKIAAPIGSKNLVFSKAADGHIVGRGILHSFTSINAEYELYGQKGVAQALGRLKLSYSSLSQAYSSDGTTPMVMTWECTGGLKVCNVICLDDKLNSVARVSCNVWATKDFATIEFMGPKASDPAFREEIVVIGVSLMFVVIQRSTNPFKLAGSVFSKTGPLEPPTQDT